MNSGDKGFTIFGVAAAGAFVVLVLSGGSCTKAQDQQKARIAVACVQAGGSWVTDNCIPNALVAK